MAQDAYTSPMAFYGALKHKAQLVARREGLPVVDIMTSYYFSRLVARVFHTQPDKWLVKGGHALFIRYAAAARLSRDVDIQHSVGSGIDEAVADLLNAAAHDLDDYLRFTPSRTSTHEGAAGAKQAFRVHMGTHEVGVVKVDVVTGRSLSAPPDVRPITPLIDLSWPTDWPRATLYPIVSHLADKICAMFERHQGTASTRYRDLADILLISQRENIDGRYAQLALRTEARRRRLLSTPGVDLVLPATFQPPGPAWPERYPTAARQVPGLKQCATWNEAAAAADAFLTPLLASGAPGNWSATDAAWEQRPEPDGPGANDRYAQRARSLADEVRARTEASSAARPHHPVRPAQPPHPGVPRPGGGPSIGKI